MSARNQRRLTPPLGWPMRLRIATITPADRQPRLVILNRYPRQIIGVVIRLPDDLTENRHDRNTGKRFGHHRSLSIVWAKPARWWKQ
jgi:hypothetical protein